MSNTTIDGLRLTFEYFGSGPGVGGISELSIETTATGVRLTWIPDVTDQSIEEATFVAELDRECGWREIVAAVNENEVYAFATLGNMEDEFPWPWDMGFEGPHNLSTEMIALTWAGPPLSEVARALATASDDQLAALHREAGSFLGKPFVERIVTVYAFASETGNELEDLVAQQRGANLDLSAIAGRLRRELQAKGIDESEVNTGWPGF